MQAVLRSAGETIRVDCGLDWVSALLRDAAPGEWRSAGTAVPVGTAVPAAADDPAGAADAVHLVVEKSDGDFPEQRGAVLTRGVWVGERAVVFDDACATGFALRVEPVGAQLRVHARFRPSLRIRAGSAVLRTRFRLVTTAVLVHYPLLWWAGVHGRAPLHASAVTTSAGVALLAGPGGVGKSTLLTRELAAGNLATCDNLAVSDGCDVFGLAEPLRVSGGGGKRAPHGRRESGWKRSRAESLRPERVVVVRLGDASPARCGEITAELAARALVTGTLMAGELRRYWAYAATLTAGTGLGPAQPPVAEVADRLTRTLPCQLVTLQRGGTQTLGELLAPALQGV